MGYVFISYSRKQSAIADRLEAALSSRSVAREPVSVWRDVNDLRAGESWDARIVAAIRGASLVVVLQSSDWRASQPCQKELAQARHYRRPILELDAAALSRESMDAASPDGITRGADDIAAQLRRLAGSSEVTANLEVRAAAWAEGGRRGRDLMRGRALSRMLKLARSADLSDSARLYLRQSTRGRRLRLLMGALAIVAVIVGEVALRVPAELQRQLEEQAVDSLRLADATSEVAAVVRTDPKRARELALSAAGDGDARNYAALLACQLALTTRLPQELSDSADFAFPDEPRPEDAAGDMAARAVPGSTRIGLTRRGQASPHAYANPGFIAFDLALSPDGRRLAALSEQGVIVYETDRGQELMVLGGATLPMGSTLSWSADGTRVAAHAPEGRTFVWDAMLETSVIADTDLWFMDVAELGDGHAAFLSRDGTVAVIDASGEKPPEIVDVLSSTQATSIARASENAVYVAALDESGDSRLWHLDLGTGESFAMSLEDGYQPLYVAASPSGVGPVAVSDGSTLLLLDATSLQSLATIETGGILAIEVDEEGRTFAGAGTTLICVEPGETSPITPQGGVVPGAQARSLAATGDGTVLAVGYGTPRGGGSRLVRYEEGVWRASSGLYPYSIPLSGACSARASAVSSDGSLFAVGLSDGTVAFLDGAGYSSYASHELSGEIRGIVFAPDGRSVIVATRDGLIARVAVNEEGLSLPSLRDALQAGVGGSTE